jgi:hypothetical protein
MGTPGEQGKNNIAGRRPDQPREICDLGAFTQQTVTVLELALHDQRREWDIAA